MSTRVRPPVWCDECEADVSGSLPHRPECSRTAARPGNRPELTDQITARVLARKRSEETPLVHVAVPYPFGCWGGTEEGWTVLTTGQLSHPRSAR